MKEIVVKFIDKDRNREEGLAFYDFESFGTWYADNFDYIEVLDIKK